MIKLIGSIMANNNEREENVVNDDDDLITSKSIVKYCAAETPKTFNKLQFNTNLNSPPSNWLSTSVAPYGLQNVVSHSIGFSSFNMAHKFPDCIGEVDVISDAENIKKLLKLPYSHGLVSMLVHRVENTLLIDDFDIYKHLLLNAQTEWKWMQKFFLEHIRKLITKKDFMLHFSEKSRTALQHKSLQSKFLYYSLLEASSSDTAKTDNDKSTHHNSKNSNPTKNCAPLLPEPNYNEQLPNSFSNHNYNRNIIWNFENLQMLLGTNLPIFGGNSHPCISLKLRDMSTPINVLTGIDCWLDNLMSNAPEVIMCYHLSGIVKKYEIIKTEDLPNLEKSKFSPKIIYDLAKNILSFLKSNATKAGHTYWLFKGNDDDVVKLYDLTCLCAPSDSEQSENPFTVPVAMLLYRVARNMKYSENDKLGTVKMLLENSISLLSKKKYPEIIASSHFMLADIYVPSTIDLRCPKLVKIDEVVNQSSNGTYESTSQLNLKKDKYAWKKDLKTKSESSTFNHQDYDSLINEYCELALKHVLEGFQCLKLMLSKDGNYPAHNFARPDQKIPMKFQSFKKKDSKKVASPKSDKDVILKSYKSCSKDVKDLYAWKSYLNELFVEKICIIYIVISDHEFTNHKYGRCLKHWFYFKYFHDQLLKLRKSTNMIEEGVLLSRIGDCCYMILKNDNHLEEYKSEFHQLSEVDEAIRTEFEVQENSDDDLHVISELMSRDKNSITADFLSASFHFYKKSAVLLKNQNSVEFQRRLGNIHNEIASYKMREMENFGEGFFDKFSNALTTLQEGIDIFKQIKDVDNIALLQANIGRLMKLNAKYYSLDTSKNLLLTLKFLKRASLAYKDALNSLKSRHNNPQVWDLIQWDLSTVTVDYAMALINKPNVSTQLVIDAFREAIDCCDLTTGRPKYIYYQYRIAMTYHKLAKIMFDDLQSKPSNNTKVSALFPITRYLDKSYEAFFTLKDLNQCCEISLAKIEMFILMANNSSRGSQLKWLEAALLAFADNERALKHNLPLNYNVDENDDVDMTLNAVQIENEIITLLCKRLQWILQNILKLYKKKTGGVVGPIKFEAFKVVYELILKASSLKSGNIYLIAQLLKTITLIKDVIGQNDR